MVYAVNFRGGSKIEEGSTFAGVFFRYTVVGYTLVLLVSLFVLWMFGQLDGTSLEETLSAAIVLGFPGAIGAAAARLII